jgi:mannan endo-1,4-beta-mannosidase
MRRFLLAAALLSCLGSCSKPAPPPTSAAPVKDTAAVPPPPPASGIRIGAPGGKFALGVNYPWLNYGHDFGVTPAWSHDGVSHSAMKAKISQDFAWLKSNGIHTVRWFVFTDGRASPDFEADGSVKGLDAKFFEDMDAALMIARENDVSIVLVLFDYLMCEDARVDNGVQLGGRASLVTDPTRHEQLASRVLKPMLERYGRNPNIAAWDIMNEPEGAMTITGGHWVSGAVSEEEMKTFVRQVASAIHRYASQPVTIGSSSRGMLGHWKDAGLDFYQFHYYDPMEGEYPLETPVADLGLDKPCIVGELPTRNNKRPVRQYLDIVKTNGYAGAFLWSMRASDESSDMEGSLPEISAWIKDNAPGLAEPEPANSPK